MIFGNIIGNHIDEIDTPALLIDLDALDRNISKMASFFASSRAKLRPHVKTHKCPIIAHKQIAAGAQGITCQKLGEAEVMVAAGIKDILIANQIVGKNKILRLMGIAKQSDVIVAVDNPGNVKDLSEAASYFNVQLNVIIEVDVGMTRAGVRNASEALELVKQISSAPYLNFRGIMGYEGFCVFIKNLEERRRQCLRANEILLDAKHQVEKAGIVVEIVSAGGTGTYLISGTNPEITEIEAGSYVMMDARYKDVEGVGFEQALSILTTVNSRPDRHRAVLDTGLKAVSSEFGIPQLRNAPGTEVIQLSEEHALVEIQGTKEGLDVGDKVELIPTHGCTTINLHDIYYGVRNGVVEVVWDIPARGKFL